MIAAGQSPIRERAFGAYLDWYLPRCFHTIYQVGSLGEFKDDGETPLLVALNHTSWWDVLLALYTERTCFGWERYGVMDERQLLRYRFFAKLGMIGVDRTSLGGAREFLNYAQKLLRGQRRSLWMTPQGAMLSTRTRPIRFQPGLAHIAGTLDRFCFTTVVVHYEFWEERLPEAFVSLSPIVTYRQEDVADRKRWQRAQEARMEAQLNSLMESVQTRDPSQFTMMLRGSAGVNPVYDALRRIRAAITGRKFHAEHGGIITPPWQSGAASPIDDRTKTP